MPASRISLQPGGRRRVRVMIVEGRAELDAASIVARDCIGAVVVAEVATAQGALDQLDEADPDLVLLDLTKPSSAGFAVLPLILARKPALAIIVIVTADAAGADLALRCLSLGAADYIAWSGSEGANQGGSCVDDGFADELARKIGTVGTERRRRTRALAEGRRPVSAVAPPRCILIGASTGGPQALATLLQALGRDVIERMPIVVVQHMPPAFTVVLAEHLALSSGCPAHELSEGEAIRSGMIHVAPGGRHLRLGSSGYEIVARLDDSPPVNFCRPSADVLFKDAAAVFGPAVLTIILTGMGRDGLDGARALAAAGASILVQDEKTSTVWGMPGSVARAGLASAVLPLEEIATAVRHLLPESTIE
ncbi:chemotaxis protein CheB [Chelatococcus sp. GCM10030263]|uniref:chemotaxis protein CheB n=1 Tax=Chelatococcus sp. GCM10030263 TaxID=3273387 RepID=UPI00361084E0